MAPGSMQRCGVRELLVDGMEQIARLPKGQGEEGIVAFNAFKRGVNQAASGRAAPPDELLSDLEPKDVAWRFMVELLQRKAMYRKQIVAVANVLLSCKPWLEALEADEALLVLLPEELERALREARGSLGEAEENEEEEESGENEPEPEKAVAPARVRKSETQRALDLLARSSAAIEALSFSASHTDDAISAFNMFQRAVMWVVSSEEKEDDEALDQLANKEQILSFVVDFYARKPTQRSRIASLCLRLLGFESWKSAVLADNSVRSAVWDMTRDPDLAEATATLKEEPATVNLDDAIDAATDKGCVGVVYVRIIAAYDLVAGSGTEDELSLHVKISAGDASVRTDAASGSLSPRWLSQPLLLEVGSWKKKLRLEVLDSDFSGDESFGYVELPIAKLPLELEPGFTRLALEGVTHGELELELLFGQAEEQKQRRARATSGSWIVATGDQPALLRQWSMTANTGD